MELIYCNDSKRKILKGECYNDRLSQACKTCPNKPQPKQRTQEPRKKPHPIRISREDRLMAIKRNDEFKRDYAELLKLREMGNKDLVFQKAFEIFKKWGEPWEAIEKAELYSRKEGFFLSVIPVIKIDREPIRNFVSGDGETSDIGEYLYLEVDIKNYPVNKLVNDFEKVIKRCKKILADKSRDREFTLDYWQVWDMHQEGKPLAQITRELYNVQGHPEYDDWSDFYKKVGRAYKKAEDIMKAIKPLS